MKKLILMFCFVMIAFVGWFFVQGNNHERELASAPLVNPYGLKTLHPETIAQLDDPFYQQIIVPDDLRDMLDQGEDVYVYFFSPACYACEQTTPIVVQATEKTNTQVVQFNVLEFNQGWNDYKLEFTPTLIRFVSGKEEARIVGKHSPSEFEQWFKDE